MPLRHLAARVCATLLFLPFTACGSAELGGGSPCASADDCGPGARCEEGMCRLAGDAGAPAADEPPGRQDDASDGGSEPGPDASPGSDGGRTRPEPAQEMCGNGLDDNGNGMIDESCSCALDEEQPCFIGDRSVAGVGACHRGVQRCEPNGEFASWGTCQDYGEPSPERCDLVDNDCDGTVDEGCECSPGATLECFEDAEGRSGPGAAGVGVCRAGSRRCVVDETGDSRWDVCEGAVFAEREACGDGLDNDCDGSVDEGCECAPGEVRGCYEDPAGEPGPGTPGVGICRDGTRECIAVPEGGSTWGPCGGAIFPEEEICGDEVDNDCNGHVDEGCTRPPEGDECVEVPFGVTEELVLSYEARISAADIMFLVDTTGSMSGEIHQIQSTLRSTIIPGLTAAIGDVELSVGAFDDFDVGSYGSSGDTPFRLLQANTSDASRADSAVAMLSASGGGDGPESQVEALYQAATGAGIGSFVPAAASCPSGGRGYPCFRPDATPIILLFTDAQFHNGPGGAHAYSGISPSPARYEETVTALQDIGAKVLGLNSGGSSGRHHLEAIARDTGAVRSDGTEVVFNIGSSGGSLDSSVISAVESLVDDVPIDVDVVIEDVGGSGSLAFVETVDTAGATPASGATDRGTWYEAVDPGTQVRFRVRFHNDHVSPAAWPRWHTARVVLRGDGVNRLVERTVTIVVPSTSGAGCP